MTHCSDSESKPKWTLRTFRSGTLRNTPRGDGGLDDDDAM
eukprot:COSAG01_NODE_72221_length_253_cov_1.324675_1_plen_39_part_10